MQIQTTEIALACSPGERRWSDVRQRLADSGLVGQIVRFFCADATAHELRCVISVADGDREPAWPSLLSFRRRSRRLDDFVVASLIPTGLRCEFGGFAGDGTPVTNLLASVADCVITNPNSVTASDLYYARDNILYAEGNLLNRFFTGELDFIPRRRDRVGLIVEKPRNERFLNNVLSAADAMVSVSGVRVDPIVVTDAPVQTTCLLSQYGHATGEYGDLDVLGQAMDVMADHELDAVGLTSSLTLAPELRWSYINGNEVPNPWGAAEAILTHFCTTFYPGNVVHAPLLTSTDDMMFGARSDVRDGAELISSSYLCSVLSGLTRAPGLAVPGHTSVPHDRQISVGDVSAVVMPATAVGNIPFLASLDHRIPIILVKQNETVSTLDAASLLGSQIPDNIYFVTSYLEAAGMLTALRHSINPRSVTRPLTPNQVIDLGRREP